MYTTSTGLYVVVPNENHADYGDVKSVDALPTDDIGAIVKRVGGNSQTQGLSCGTEGRCVYA